MKINYLIFLMIVFLHNYSIKAQKIILQGFVPPSITEATIIYEYKRIFHFFKPDDPIESSPITVIFISKSDNKQEHYSLPEWGGGGTIGSHKILMNMDKSPFLDHNLYQTLIHELVHLVINRICENIYIPRWFHEGVAMYLSCDITNRENLVISKALFSGSLMGLAAIDSVNSFGRFRAELAYCQSRQAVQYLIDTYGIEIIGEIISALNTESSFKQGFFKVLNITELEFESWYRKYIFQNHGKFSWLIDTYMLWFGLVILFIVGYIVTVIRVKKRKKMMED